MDKGVLPIKVADRLIDIGALRFTLNASRPICINLNTPSHATRPGPVDKETVAMFALSMWELAGTRRLSFDCVAGVLETGDAVVAKMLARQNGYSQLRFANSQSSEETARLSLSPGGSYKPGETVLVVETLFGSANNCLSILDACKRAQVNVRDVLSLIDLQQGGVRQLAEQSVRLRTVLGIDRLLAYYLRTGVISPEQHKNTIRYLAAAA